MTQAEAAEDMKSSTKKQNEMATWETETALSSEELRKMEAWEMEMMNMDPDANTISLWYNDQEFLFTCNSAEGVFASDVRQAWSIKTGFPARVVLLIDMDYGEVFDDTMLVPPNTRLDVMLDKLDCQGCGLFASENLDATARMAGS